MIPPANDVFVAVFASSNVFAPPISNGTFACRFAPVTRGICCLPRIVPVDELFALLIFDVIKKSALTPGTLISISKLFVLNEVTVKLLLAKLITLFGVIPYVPLVAESDLMKQMMLFRINSSEIVPGVVENVNVSVPSAVMVNLLVPASDVLFA